MRLAIGNNPTKSGFKGAVAMEIPVQQHSQQCVRTTCDFEGLNVHRRIGAVTFVNLSRLLFEFWLSSGRSNVNSCDSTL
jgi:hypothetical protein